MAVAILATEMLPSADLVAAAGPELLVPMESIPSNDGVIHCALPLEAGLPEPANPYQTEKKMQNRCRGTPAPFAPAPETIVCINREKHAICMHRCSDPQLIQSTKMYSLPLSALSSSSREPQLFCGIADWKL